MYKIVAKIVLSGVVYLFSACNSNSYKVIAQNKISGLTKNMLLKTHQSTNEYDFLYFYDIHYGLLSKTYQHITGGMDHTYNPSYNSENITLRYNKVTAEWSYTKFLKKENICTIYYKCYDIGSLRELKTMREKLDIIGLEFVNLKLENSFYNRFSVSSFYLFLDNINLPALTFNKKAFEKSFDIIRVFPRDSKRPDVYQKDEFYIIQNGIVEKYVSDEFFVAEVNYRNKFYVITQNKEKNIHIYSDGNLIKNIATKNELTNFSHLILNDKMVFHSDSPFSLFESKDIVFNFMIFPFCKIEENKVEYSDIEFFIDYHNYGYYDEYKNKILGLYGIK